MEHATLFLYLLWTTLSFSFSLLVRTFTILVPMGANCNKTPHRLTKQLILFFT